MIFNIDSEMVIQQISDALETAGDDTSEIQFMKICEAIEKGMPGVIAVLTNGMTEVWRDEAERAGGWGSKYARAIKNRIKGNVGEIFIDEEMTDKQSNKPNFMFAMMMEKGVKSWSIKDALLASEKAKVSSDGIKYIVIPFPVAVPRKDHSMRNAAQFGNREMTQEMHDIVKGGGKLSNDATLNVQGKEVNVGGLTQYNTRKYHSQYGFFRCVSEKSKGWQYPNVPPEPVYANVLQEVNKRIQEILSEFCKEIVKEYSGK